MTVEDDEAIARALQEKYEKQAKKRSHRMSGRNNANRGRDTLSNRSGYDSGAASGSEDEGGAVSLRASSHAGRPTLTAQGRSSRAIEQSITNERTGHLSNNAHVEAKVPDTSKDEEIARRLAERSSHHRSTDRYRKTDPPEEHKADDVPNTANDAELARRLAERSTHRRSNATRAASSRRIVPPEPKDEEVTPDVSNDAEIARRLAERSSHRRAASSRGSSVEPSLRHSALQSEDQKEEVVPPDTSKDEALARRLAERSSHRRTMERSSRRVVEPPKEPVAPVPDTSKDEELARRLALALQQPKSRRRIEPPEEKTTAEDDEALARRLQQELKDEELAQRLSQQEAKRRRRATHLARKKAAQRNRGEDTSNPPESKPTVVGDRPVGEPTRSLNQLRGKSSVDLLSSDSGEEIGDTGSGEEMERGRSRQARSSRNFSRTRSRSRDPDTGVGRSRPARSRSRDADDRGMSRAMSSHVGSSSRAMSSRDLRKYESKRNMRSVSPTRREQAPIIDLHETSDREYAEKLDQESRDEALARTLTMREANRIAVYQVGTEQYSGGRHRWTCRRILSLAIPVVVIMAAIVGVVFAVTGGNGIPLLPGGGNLSPPTFQEGDPFQGKSPSEANRWNNQPAGQGLKLEVLNALDERWHVTFDIAISNWDFGNPDALTLTVSQVSVDSTCKDKTGFLKVCNGDYGETKWRGINQVILSNGYIISSVAKLNEFYLATADEAQRQYTMCHEIGHGFGLPHSDENFFNADLGNCMDYTSNPEANKTPDETNYAFLVDLYGTVKTRRLSQKRTRSNIKTLETLPDDLHLRADEAMMELEEGVIFSHGHYKAKMLHQSTYAESVLIDLNDGFQLHVSKLLAVVP